MNCNVIKFVHLALACCLLSAVSCSNREKAMEGFLTESSIPVIGVKSLRFTTNEVSGRRVIGAVLFNCIQINSKEELQQARPRLAIFTTNELIQEMLLNEIQIRKEKPEYPKVPVFFLSSERFSLFEFDYEQSVYLTKQISLQNIKILLEDEFQEPEK